MIYSNFPLKEEDRKRVLQIVEKLEQLNDLMVQIVSEGERAKCVRSLKNSRTKMEEAIFWINDAMDVDNRASFRT